MSASARSRAEVPTASGSRYLQQLCKHWSHKNEVSFDAGSGTIRFPSGAVAKLDAVSDRLIVVVEVPAGEELTRMEEVVQRHLDRFAFREAPLPFDWQRIAPED